MAQSKEVLSAHKHAESRTNAQKTALHDAMMQVKDENTLEIPTWGDFFQEITENKDEKAFSAFHVAQTIIKKHWTAFHVAQTIIKKAVNHGMRGAGGMVDWYLVHLICL